MTAEKALKEIFIIVKSNFALILGNYDNALHSPHRSALF